jgi:hypothetical protein
MLAMIQAKLPLTVEDAKVSKVERKVPAKDKLTTVGRGAPGGDPLFDASLAMEHAATEDSRKGPLTDQDANRANMVPRGPIITDKFTVVGLSDDLLDRYREYIPDKGMVRKLRYRENVPDKGVVRKLPLTVDDTNVSNVKRRLPKAAGNPNFGLTRDPLLKASMTQHAGPRGGVVRKLPLTLVDARVSNVDRRVPPQHNPVQDRGELVGDPLLDATLEEQEERDDTITYEGTAVHLDVRHKMKSKFPCTSVVGPEDVHREVGPPKA